MPAVTAETEHSIIEISYFATQSKRAPTAIIAKIIIPLIFVMFGTLESASSMACTFVRDEGFRFPNTSHMYNMVFVFFQGDILPLTTLRFVTTISSLFMPFSSPQRLISFLLEFISFKSSKIFNAMTSLALIGHYSLYLLPIALFVMRLFGKTHNSFRPCSLAWYGLLQST